VRSEGILGHQLLRHVPGEVAVEAAPHVNRREFLFFGLRLRRQLASFERENPLARCRPES
jgi:hypothetical protein